MIGQLPSPPFPRRRRAGREGFTLLEVVLALVIAVGLLAVALYFYQQASKLRDATLAESTGLAAVRLAMDRLATELGTASPQSGAFHGGSQEIKFVGSSSANPNFWGADPNATAAAFPVVRIRCALLRTNDSGGGGGLEWVEEPINTAPAQTSNSLDVASEDTENTTAETNLADVLGSNVPPVLPGATDALAGLGFTDTNSPSTLGNTNVGATSVISTASVVIPQLLYFQLRYWDGTTWQTSWDGDDLPRAVEISMGTEAPPADATTNATPGEFFRRLVVLPLAQVNSNAATNASAGSYGTGMNLNGTGEGGS